MFSEPFYCFGGIEQGTLIVNMHLAPVASVESKRVILAASGRLCSSEKGHRSLWRRFGHHDDARRDIIYSGFGNEKNIILSAVASALPFIFPVLKRNSL